MISTIEAREITYSNVDDLLALAVGEDQKHLVAPNSVTIAQASCMPNSWTRGLWLADDAVGLIAMIDIGEGHPGIDDHTPANIAFLWRLMVDASHQGRGYDSQAIHLAFEQARRWCRTTLYSSVAQGDGNALHFYWRFGLEPTGEIDDDELVLRGPVPKSSSLPGRRKS